MKRGLKLTSAIRQKLVKFNTLRRIIQFLSFIFFSTVIFNLDSIPLLLPVMWTWGLKPNIAGDAFTAMQLMLSGWKEPYTIVFPWLAIASFLIVGILIGKSLCGWVCPFGFVQDLVDLMKRKKKGFSPRTHKSMLYVKFLFLGIPLLISATYAATKFSRFGINYRQAFGVFVDAPFSALSPAETLFAIIPQRVQGFANAVAEGHADIFYEISVAPMLLWVQLIIMFVILIFAAYVPRGWCKYFCPHGAIMALLNRFSFLGLRRDPVKCAKGDCRVCVEACPMRVPILNLSWEKFSDPECIYCLKCADACPHKAIKLKYP